MNFLGKGFQKLEHYGVDNHTQINGTEHVTTLHL